jgi:hypothetical protein
MSEKQAGRFPNLGAICDSVGVSMTAVDRHIREDSVFKSAWDEIVLRTDAQAMQECWNLRKKNPLFLFGLMRRIMPSRWNPDSKSTVDVNIQMAPQLIHKASAIDAELSTEQGRLNGQSSTETTGPGKEIPQPPASDYDMAPPPTAPNKKTSQNPRVGER